MILIELRICSLDFIEIFSTLLLKYLSPILDLLDNFAKEILKNIFLKKTLIFLNLFMKKSYLFLVSYKIFQQFNNSYYYYYYY